MKRPSFSFSPRQSSSGRIVSPAAHDPGRVHRVQRARVGGRDHRDLVVHFIHQAARVAGREVLELGVARELEEVAGEVRIGVLVRLIGAEHVPAGAPHGPVELDVQGPRALGGDDPHHVALLDPAPAAEGEVHQHAGVTLEHLLGRRVRHRPTLSGPG